MTFVVTDSCINCKYGECVEVCPQDAFHEGINFVVINPNTCSNCGLCEMVCPVDAIFPIYNLPVDFSIFIKINILIENELRMIEISCNYKIIHHAFTGF